MRPRRILRVVTVLALALSAGLPATAKDPEALRWSFRKPVRVEPPTREALKHAERVANPIDQFVLQRLEESGMEPAPPAGRATLVRRAYFDLLGLPPAPEVKRTDVEFGAEDDDGTQRADEV